VINLKYILQIQHFFVRPISRSQLLCKSLSFYNSHLKEEALDRTMWRARFGRGFGPVVRETTK
jgi:hypothetical protein